MSKDSRKFKVPDELANLYDFANSLDVRHFTHHGVQHLQSDELEGPRELGAWVSQRGLLWSGAKITPAMFDTALQLRSSVRAYLEIDPAERRKAGDSVRSLNKAMRLFPLVAEARNDGVMALRAGRDDALAGLSVVVADAAMVHVHAVREPDQDPSLSRASTRGRLSFEARDSTPSSLRSITGRRVL